MQSNPPSRSLTLTLHGIFAGALALLTLAPELQAERWRIETAAGTGVRGSSGAGGPALKAELDQPFGIVRGPDGALWFCEYTGQRIRRIAPDGTLTNEFGSGKKGYSGDGGPAAEATFNLPHEIRFDRAGDLFVVDMSNHVVRKIDMRSRTIRTIAGTGQPGYSGDGGPAVQAQFKQPHSIQFGPQGELFVCDTGNHVVRRMDLTSGRIETFAGTGSPGATPNASPLAGTPLKGPRSLDVDSRGFLWLATREGNQLFQIDLRAGKIFHKAGTGAKGFAGHGGPALEALMNGPKGVAADAKGNVWIVDTETHSIRRFHAASGTLQLMAGTGQKGDGPDGDPLQCAMNRPHGIFVDVDGAVWITDSEAHKIRVMRQVEP
jgi:streptogramin lyase